MFNLCFGIKKKKKKINQFVYVKKNDKIFIIMIKNEMIILNNKKNDIK